MTDSNHDVQIEHLSSSATRVGFDIPGHVGWTIIPLSPGTDRWSLTFRDPAAWERFESEVRRAFGPQPSWLARAWAWVKGNTNGGK